MLVYLVDHLMICVHALHAIYIGGIGGLGGLPVFNPHPIDIILLDWFGLTDPLISLSLRLWTYIFGGVVMFARLPGTLI